MLSKPMNGLTQIKIGNILETANYKTDVPIKILKAFLFSLENNLPATLKLENDNYDYIIVIDEWNTHIIKDKTDDYLSDNSVNQFIYKTVGINISDIFESLILDIEMYFDDWVNWLEYDGGERKYKSKREIELNELLYVLKYHMS